jgi:TonB family protein
MKRYSLSFAISLIVHIFISAAFLTLLAKEPQNTQRKSIISINNISLTKPQKVQKKPKAKPKKYIQKEKPQPKKKETINKKIIDKPKTSYDQNKTIIQNKPTYTKSKQIINSKLTPKKTNNIKIDAKNTSNNSSFTTHSTGQATQITPTYEERYISRKLPIIISAINSAKYYPSKALKRKKEGIIKAFISLDQNGLKQIKILSGSKIFHKDVIRMIKKASKHFPAPNQEINLTLPIEFKLY